jgi:hypothetical protein
MIVGVSGGGPRGKDKTFRIHLINLDMAGGGKWELVEMRLVLF